MARVKLSEYAAKSRLVEDYAGVAITLDALDACIDALDPERSYAIKVDQGIKKRGKQGLIRLNISKPGAKQAVLELAEKGYSRFVAEPMVPHEESEEQYLSIERTRSGFKILHSVVGGVDVETHPDAIRQYAHSDEVPLPRSFLAHCIEVMDREHFSFIEINPLIVRGDECLLLDAAVLVDSAGSSAASWSEDDIVEAGWKNEAERVIAELNDGSPAAFSFRVLNPNGALWLLLSGGGASITIADEAANRGKAEMIGNYGEYSGGPTREETQMYTEAVVRQVLQSQAPRKAVIIAGGVANFTDVKQTFAGIIDALQEHIDELKAAGMKVFVRRGGPNEAEGLALMKDFLIRNDIFGSIHGSETTLTTVINEALEAVDAQY